MVEKYVKKTSVPKWFWGVLRRGFMEHNVALNVMGNSEDLAPSLLFARAGACTNTPTEPRTSCLLGKHSPD